MTSTSVDVRYNPSKRFRSVSNKHLSKALLAARSYEKKIYQKMLSYYVETTGLTAKQVTSLFYKDDGEVTLLNADEAKHHGLVDFVSDEPFEFQNGFFPSWLA